MNTELNSKKWNSKIEENVKWIGVKPYSHNMIGLALGALKIDCNWTDEQISEIVIKYGLDKKGWSYLVC